MDVPVLEGDALAAVKHRGGHLQMNEEGLL